MKDLRKKRLIVAIEDFGNSCLPMFPSTGSVSKCGMDITEALERIYGQRGDRDFVIKCSKELPQFVDVIEFMMNHKLCFLEIVPRYIEVSVNKAAYGYHFISPEDKIVFLWRDTNGASYICTNWDIYGADIANNIYAMKFSFEPLWTNRELHVMDLFGSGNVQPTGDSTVRSSSEENVVADLEAMNLFGMTTIKKPGLIKIYRRISPIIRSWLSLYLQAAIVRFDEDNNPKFDECFKSVQFISDTLKGVRTAENAVQVEKASILMEHILNHEAVIAGIMEEH